MFFVCLFVVVVVVVFCFVFVCFAFFSFLSLKKKEEEKKRKAKLTTMIQDPLAPMMSAKCSDGNQVLPVRLSVCPSSRPLGGDVSV